MYAKLSNGTFTGGGYAEYSSRVVEAILSTPDVVYADVDYVEEPREATLDELKAGKILQINTYTLNAIDVGFEYDGHTYDSDDRSKTNIIGTGAAIKAGYELPEGFTWRTQDNESVAFDAEGITALGTALMDHVFSNYQTSWQLKAQVNQAESLEDLNAIDVPGAFA